MPSLAEVGDSILLVVDSVPAGQVTTYGDIAKVVGCGPRLVARVLAGSGGRVRWWRVIRADGSIAPTLVAEATQHLVGEGVAVCSGRVELARFRAQLD